MVLVLECLDMQTDVISSVYALIAKHSHGDCWFWFSFFVRHVHPPALLPTRSVNIVSRHCAAAISCFAAASCLISHSCFLPQYVACRAGFDLGLMPLLLILRACCACLLACHGMAPPSVQNGPAAPSAPRH